MSTTASRNGSDKPAPVTGAQDVFDRFRAIGKDAVEALRQVEERRKQMAYRHQQEMDALRERQASERATLTAEAKQLREVCKVLKVEAPAATKLGPGGRPTQPTKAPTRSRVPKKESLKAAIAAFLELTKDGESVTTARIAESIPNVPDTRNVVYSTVNHLRDEELARPNGRTGGTGKPTLWAVWDRAKLTRYMESLDA